MSHKIIELIAAELSLKIAQVRTTVSLLTDGATVPFIARYRKEVTGSLDEIQISHIQKSNTKYNDLVSRKETILKAIKEQGKLAPQLESQILQCWDTVQLEDLYLPYKKKRKTKATIAREQGLEPLAAYITAQRHAALRNEAKKYLQGQIKTIDQAIAGAQDIIAEDISEDLKFREKTRASLRKYGEIIAKVVKKKKDEASKYKDYFDFREQLSKCPSHRFLAIHRGAEEGYLRVSYDMDHESILHYTMRKYVSPNAPCAEVYRDAIRDGYKRLILPSVETQIHKEYKEKADLEAIKVFTKNLRQLLLSPPLGQKTTLALDPGYRTGCKTVVLSKHGHLLEHTTIYPHTTGDDTKAAMKLKDLVTRHKVEVIAIGNGTAGRETESFVKTHLPSHDVYMVNEDGASIYSASEIAREEFPKEDITVRGAVSIGRRLMDPLAELVKIDPKSIGVGQYQHDVNQSLLKQALDETVMSSVNAVGININTASKHLLTYISGLGPVTAANIVAHRQAHGNFESKSDLKKVARIGAKAFEQAAGFLRIRNGKNMLDNTGVHPESYSIVVKMAKDMGAKPTDLVSNPALLEKIDLKNYVSDTVGLPTLRDILQELKKPGLDPRGSVSKFAFDGRLRTIDDVRVGMILPGIISNITNFGAFVDIGIKQGGLIHISQIANKYISDPAEVLDLNQQVTVKVTDIDHQRGRISLTMKDL